jgi:hypothetical protein
MISMMQAADAVHSHDLGGPPRPWFDQPESRRLLLQGIMNAIVVVLEVISKQPTEMGFVQDDHVVPKFPPTTSHPALRHAVRLSRQLHRMETVTHDVFG